ncbi:hypothetical protein ACFLUR_00585 [Chloroflexota bacterium]
MKDRVGGSLQDLIERPEWPYFIPSQLIDLESVKYADSLRRVEKAFPSGTAKEKGDSLEELADCLLGSIKAFKVNPKELTPSGELDRYLTVSKIPGTLLQDWSTYVPVECKNWGEPVGVQVINDLYAKAKKMGSNRGILFSREGVTGTANFDGWREIVNLFVSDRYVTIVINLEDLKSIESGTNPLDVIERYQRAVHVGA